MRKTGFATLLAAASIVALGATMAPSTAFAAEGDVIIEGDTYRQVIFDHALKPSDSERWEARCPKDYPYLSKARSSNDEHVGYGLHITQETPSALHMVDIPWARWPIQIDDERQAITRNTGTVTNWSVTRQHLRIEMVCTTSTNVDDAWIELISKLIAE